jgi:phage tail sheath protein FI
VNTLWQEPAGFLALAADTLADDPDLAPISVRRLLILLRRLALRQGAAYVFEPNGDAFQRLVERGFGAILDDLYRRGAFAGAAPEDAYRVVVDASVNPPASVDLGRFIVELKVAPALPLEFVTVRLVQSGERGVVTEVT